MALTLLKKLSRPEICDGLGVSYSDRAVILGKGGKVAIVINESGKSGTMKYYNKLQRGVSLEMQGRDDELGDVLQGSNSVLLFFRYDKTANDPDYTYEGIFEYQAIQPVTMIRNFVYKP